MHHTRETINELLEQCREYYQQNTPELEKIDAFELT